MEGNKTDWMNKLMCSNGSTVESTGIVNYCFANNKKKQKTKEKMKNEVQKLEQRNGKEKMYDKKSCVN